MDLLTVAELAAHWRLQPQTVRATIRAGRLNAARISRCYRVRWYDVWACEQGPRPTDATAARYRTPLLSKADVAAITRTSERSVDRWVGEGLPTRNVGPTVRINRGDLRDWLCRRYGLDIDAATAEPNPWRRDP